MEGQTDKMNYREDVQVIDMQWFLEITKPFWNINKKYVLCHLCMTDRLTDKVNFTIDAHWYRESPTKLLISILKTVDPLKTFLNS